MFDALAVAQVVIAVSVLFVWVFRLENIEREFREYGLPDLVRNAVGATKIAAATLLLAGLWYPALVFAPAVVMAALMLCAQIPHARARHAPIKYAASFLLLVLSVYVALMARGVLR
jgi:hypothetical protein